MQVFEHRSMSDPQTTAQCAESAIKNKLRVVIVEDHLITIEGLKVALQGESDLEIVGTATKCRQGLELVKELKPDVVMLDLHLPDSDGPKSLISEFAKYPETKIVVFSSEDRLPIIHMVLKMGVAAYLSKAEPPSRVAEITRQVCAGEKPVVSADLMTPGTKLTRAEEHLLRLLARGMKPPEIATLRVVAPATVRKQIELLILKLNLANREELIAWAVQNGFAELDIER
jgi:DNA-binding NarL/FixJ family response regulator